MQTVRPLLPASRQPDTAAEPASSAFDGMLRHVPTMDLPFDGDCVQANGIDLPIIAINLAHRTDKWETLSQRLSAVGLTKVIRAPAVEGARLPASQVAQLLRSPADATESGPASHLTLTPPAVGCFLSHLAVWRWMVAAGLPRLLVLEDDAQPIAPFSTDGLRKVLAKTSDETGLVLLGCRIMAGLADRPKEGAELARVYYFNGTHAYLITPMGCRALLQLLLPLYAHLDHQMSNVLIEHRHAFSAYYATQPFFDCDWSFGSDLYIPAHHLSDESAADRELGEIIESAKRSLLTEGRPLLVERDE